MREKHLIGKSRSVISRRETLMFGAAAILASPSLIARADPIQPETKMNSVKAISVSSDSIRPFRVNFPQSALDKLRRRVRETNWPERETVADASQGVRLATMQALAGHWGGKYDWRRAEARLNAVPNFITEIDGLDIHFIHVRSPHSDALPMIITHGWPGSVIEQLKIVGPLTNPTAHGGSAADAFHLVIPSLPGYGFSGKPTAPGWNPISIARAWAKLMQRLGYSRYVAQGGDWGNAVSEVMALQRPPGLLGIHTNMASTLQPDVARGVALHEAPPANLTAEERNAWDQLDSFYKKGLGYAIEMSNRPQTLYALVDSPIGLAAWMLDHDERSQEMIARAFAGGSEGLSQDDVLDNITLYWLTNTAVSSARLYWDTTQLGAGGFFDARGVTLPVAVSVFPDEIYAAPRSWAERAYPNLIYFNRLDRGGHFAAWEQPQLFTQEMRAAFRTLRG
jgi:pimeloyl-ACP methyl ester carboxylesterase